MLKKGSMGCYTKSIDLWLKESRRGQSRGDGLASALRECELLHDLCLAVAGPYTESVSSHYSIVANYTVAEADNKNLTLWIKHCPGKRFSTVTINVQR